MPLDGNYKLRSLGPLDRFDYSIDWAGGNNCEALPGAIDRLVMARIYGKIGFLLRKLAQYA